MKLLRKQKAGTVNVAGIMVKIMVTSAVLLLITGFSTTSKELNSGLS